MDRWLKTVVVLALAVGALGAESIGGETLAAGSERAVRRRPPGPVEKAERRRWALAKMDEVANERRRCRDRHTAPRQVEACEAELARRFREYNEIYLEAARD